MSWARFTKVCSIMACVTGVQDGKTLLAYKDMVLRDSTTKVANVASERVFPVVGAAPPNFRPNADGSPITAMGYASALTNTKFVNTTLFHAVVSGDNPSI